MQNKELKRKSKPLLSCSFCGGEARLQLLDGEGNWRDEEYLENAWSGISYGVVHDRSMSTDDCPIATYTEDEKTHGTWLYDTPEEAIKAWNTRKPMERIIEQLEDRYDKMHEAYMDSRDLIDLGRKYGMEYAIEIVKKEGRIE